MAPFQARLESARAAARGAPIRPSDFEVRVGTHYTVETLDKLKRRYPNHDFIWLMGAGQLAKFSLVARLEGDCAQGSDCGHLAPRL